MRRALAVLATALPGSAFADVPSVVTDTPVVHSLTSRIMGELGKPSVILEPGADPHSFQLRPSQAAALGDADLVFWAGEELTPWLARAVGNLGGGATLVTLPDVDGLSLIESGDGTHDHGHEQDDDHDHGHDEHAADDHDHDHDHAEDDHGHGDDHAHDDDHAHGDHDHGGIDPHAWLDPAHGMLWADEIAAALAAADPDNAAVYAANAEAAKSDISAAADRAAGRLADLDGRSIITFHDAYGYFARAFDIRVAGSVALGDAAAPGARRVSELRETAGGAGIACIFSEPQHDASIAEAISRDTGIPLGTLDPSGSTMDYGPGLYPALLETMAAAIADCALISR